MTAGRLLIRNAEVGGACVDVRCSGATIMEIAASLRPAGDDAVGQAGDEQVDEQVIDARGGALLPGLHDHHIHLLALAAAQDSVTCGPPAVNNLADLAGVLRRARGSGWIRGVGYHESVAGELDRLRLDAIVSDQPLRIQHRSGVMWFVNSRGAEALGLDAARDVQGIERNADGTASGRLFRLDNWLRERIGAGEPPSLRAVSRQLAARGVTSVTDTTPHNNADTVAVFRHAQATGDLQQHVLLMGDDSLGFTSDVRLQCGALKVMLDEASLPELDMLTARVSAAHAAGRIVAFHCVTRTELLFALESLRGADAPPTGRRDRIEHAALAGIDTLPLLLEAGVAVVTQPNLVAERGDQFLAEIPAPEHGDLYRLRSLLAAHIPLAGSTDAPFGQPDPWRAMCAAQDRLVPDGRPLGATEALDAEAALALFTGRADQPGDSQRRVAPGEPANLCLLHEPWHAARLRLDATLVRCAVIDGVPAEHNP